MKEELNGELKNKKEGIFSKIVEDITKNHNRIIDDFCKAYLSHLVEKGIDIKPDCLRLFHKQPSPLNGDMVNEYWFELKDKEETANEKLLKQVMKQLNRLIVYVDEQITKCRGNTEKIPVLLVLDEINGFLNFVDTENE